MPYVCYAPLIPQGEPWLRAAKEGTPFLAAAFQHPQHREEALPSWHATPPARLFQPPFVVPTALEPDVAMAREDLEVSYWKLREASISMLAMLGMPQSADGTELSDTEVLSMSWH